MILRYCSNIQANTSSILAGHLLKARRVHCCKYEATSGSLISRYSLTLESAGYVNLWMGRST